MKALVYIAPYTLEFTDVVEPVPSAGEVLVRVEAVGICGSDVHAYHGHDSRRAPPVILGHEASGEAMNGLFKGQKVTINPLVTPTDGKFARFGRPNLDSRRQIISMQPRPGAFAQYVVIPESNVIPLPENFDVGTAALAEPLAVSWRAAKRGCALLMRPLDEARAVVLGGGAIGLGAALALRHFGVRDIAVAETNPARHSMISAQGGFRLYVPGESAAPKENSVDLVIDAVGAASTRTAACQMVEPGGVIVHIGLLPGSDGLDVRKITLQEIMLTGAYCYTPDDFRDTVAAMIAGDLGSLDWFETRALSEGANAFADIDNGLISHAKVVLRP